MKTLTQQLKQALSALALADIGERAGTRAINAALYPDATQAGAPSPAAPSRKWIALGVGDSLPTPVMTYVIGACQRMQADLLLFSVDAMRVRTLLAEYLPALEGINCMTEELERGSTAAVLRAMNLHRGLLFAVSGTQDDPLRPFLRGGRAPRAPVPIVLVSEKSSETPRRLARGFACAT
jgi:hypothetical protein